MERDNREDIEVTDIELEGGDREDIQQPLLNKKTKICKKLA